MKILIFRVEYIIIKMVNYKFIFGRKAYEAVKKIRERAVVDGDRMQPVHYDSF